MEKLTFSLKLKERPVEIIGADGVRRDYVLKELTGAARDAWFDDYNRRRIFKDGKDTGQLKDLSGFQATFVSVCLYDAQGVNVPVDVVQTFPSHVVEGLFLAAQTLSGLDRGAIDLAKNV